MGGEDEEKTSPGGSRLGAIDGLTVADTSQPTLAALHKLVNDVDLLAQETLVLRQPVAPLTAQLPDRKDAAISARSAWSSAISSKDTTPEQAAQLKAALAELNAEAAHLEAAVGPAERGATGRGCEHECSTRRHHGSHDRGQRRGVSPGPSLRARGTALGRRASHPRPTRAAHPGRGRHHDPAVPSRVIQPSRLPLRSACAAWALLDVKTGTLKGGAKRRAKQMVHDLDTGDAWGLKDEAIVAQGVPIAAATAGEEGDTLGGHGTRPRRLPRPRHLHHHPNGCRARRTSNVASSTTSSPEAWS